MTKAQASAVVDAVFSAISDSLARDESVAIPGFGTFATRCTGSPAPHEPPVPRRWRSPSVAAGRSHTAWRSGSW